MLVPIIQYSSMFTKTSNLAHYYSDNETKQDSIRFIQLDRGLLELIFASI